MLLALAIGRTALVALQILGRPRHPPGLLVALGPGDEPVALLGRHGRAGHVVEALQLGAVPHEHGSAVARDQGLTEEEVDELLGFLRHPGIPHDPVRLQVDASG